MTFLKTGIFDFNFQGFYSVKYYDLDAPNKLDFIGLNYYATAVIGFNSDNFFGDTCFPGQIMGDMNLQKVSHKLFMTLQNLKNQFISRKMAWPTT